MGIDAIVIGAGPNGLAAGVVLARAGLSVVILEKETQIGGSAKTVELGSSKSRHDFGSAVHPMALASPFFSAFQLQARVKFHLPEISYAHVSADSEIGLAFRDLEKTADFLGRDGKSWTRLFTPLVRDAQQLANLSTSNALSSSLNYEFLRVFVPRVVQRGSIFKDLAFRDHLAPALLEGSEFHINGGRFSLSRAAVGLTLATFAHSHGWPIPEGGSGAITEALLADFLDHGGQVFTDTTVSSLNDLAEARAVLVSTDAQDFLKILPEHVSEKYVASLRRIRRSPGVTKHDFVLSEKVPWLDPNLNLAGTIHLGASKKSRYANSISKTPDESLPFGILSQPSNFDTTRTTNGNHVVWAYERPAGHSAYHISSIEDRIEKVAPGFKDTIIEHHTHTALDLEMGNSNIKAGDITGGEIDLRRLISSPTLGRFPWRTPIENVYFCSANTSPGPGVHGMAGYHAALTALRFSFSIHNIPDLSNS